MKKLETGQSLKSLVGSNIRRLRSSMGFTLEELAERTKISVPYLGAIERGEKWPGAATFEKMAKGLEALPYDLLEPEDSTHRDINKILTEMASDIETTVNKSVRKIHTVIKNSQKP